MIVPNGDTGKIAKSAVVIKRPAPHVTQSMVIALVKTDIKANFAIAKLEFIPATLRRHTVTPMREGKECVFANLGCL